MKAMALRQLAYLGLCIIAACSPRPRRDSPDAGRCLENLQKTYIDVNLSLTGGVMNSDAIREVLRKSGRRCPICSKAYRLNPDPEAWAPKSTSSEVAIVCDCAHYDRSGRLLFQAIRFDGTVALSATEWRFKELSGKSRK
jgi:hypothetical protein